jgi:hypothetical protein
MLMPVQSKPVARKGASVKSNAGVTPSCCVEICTPIGCVCVVQGC